MKKFIFIVVLAMLVGGFCFAQSSTNDAQRLVGTWVEEDGGYTLVLNANGTGTINHPRQTAGRNDNISWGVSNSGELCTVPRIIANYFEPFFLSPDGRRMIFGNLVFIKR